MSSHRVDPIRVGVVGLGRAGVNIHLKALRADSRFKVTAVCDPLEARSQSVATPLGAQPFSSLKDLVASGLCQLVVIATPSCEHSNDATMVLESGFDCVLEKPMAANAAEARALVELAERKGRKLFVHHQYLFDDELLFLQEVIASGVLGKIFHIEVFWTGYSRRWDWQTLRKNGGGQLLNTCPHLISLLLPLLGGDLSVETADVRLIKDAGDAGDHVKMSLKGCNGITVSAMVSSACALPLPRLTLFGSHGTLQENYTQATLRYFDPASVPQRTAIDTAAATDGSLQEELPWKEEQVPVCPKKSAGRFYDNVAGVLLHGDPLRVDPAEAARVVKILETIATFATLP